MSLMTNKNNYRAQHCFRSFITPLSIFSFITVISQTILFLLQIFENHQNCNFKQTLCKIHIEYSTWLTYFFLQMSEGKNQKLGKNSRAQLNNEENNPCFKEHQLSLECLTKNNYDNQKCAFHFENYNTCKSFWNAVSKKRRNNGIKPHLPPLEERKIIRENYLKTGTM